MVIRAIVYAPDKDQAFDKATHIFEQLCENQTPFDYFTTFDHNSLPGSGRRRWGKLSPVSEVNTKTGKKLIEDGMKATEEEFKQNMVEIRKAITKFTDKQLLNESGFGFGNIEDKKLSTNDKHTLSLFRYYCYAVGKYNGSSIWLYDNDGSGIRDRNHLKNALNKWDNEDYEGLKVFVVPADVHY
jgi:hypothetical protein